MVARNRYLVIHPPGSKEQTREVFADELTMCSTGDILFKQVRKSALVNDEGERRMEDDMVPVLVLRVGTFDTIQLMPPSGESPVYKQSGVIELAH